MAFSDYTAKFGYLFTAGTGRLNQNRNYNNYGYCTDWRIFKGVVYQDRVD